jgi:acyl-CoA-binding protein
LPRSGQIQPTYNDKLLLYSLFKQAVHGDVKSSTISKRPGVFDMLGRAKWDAWKAKEGLSCTAAKRLYIESVLKVCQTVDSSKNSLHISFSALLYIYIYICEVFTHLIATHIQTLSAETHG